MDNQNAVLEMNAAGLDTIPNQTVAISPLPVHRSAPDDEYALPWLQGRVILSGPSREPASLGRERLGMTEDERHHHPDHAAAILDVKGARHVGPAEAESMLAECLSLTRNNLETAFWKAMEELEAIPVAGEHSDLHSGSAPLDRDFRTAVTAERRQLSPRFMESYEAAFHERVRGKSRDARRQKK